jgi:hypothetical protein
MTASALFDAGDFQNSSICRPARLTVPLEKLVSGGGLNGSALRGVIDPQATFHEAAG